MAHIVYLTYGITSYLNASYYLAKQLRQAGHHVTYLSSFDCREAVERQGFDFVHLAQEAAQRNDPEKLALERMPRTQRYLNIGQQRKVARRSAAFWLSSTELSETLARLQPDLLLIDEELPEHIVVASRLAIPVRLVQMLLGTRQFDGVPPAESALVPQKDGGNSAEIKRAWQTLLRKRRIAYQLAPLYFGGNDRRTVVRKLAEQVGYDVANLETDNWTPLTHRHLKTLAFIAPSFEFPCAPPARVNYVGPLIDVQRLENVRDPAYQAFLGALDGSKKLIFASVGTFFQADAGFLQRIVDAVSPRDDWQLVLSVGKSVAAERFDPLPKNVHVFSHVPQIDLLKRTDLLLTHGGIATANEAILLGVPMIVYSGGKMDQDGTAARVAYHEIGLVGQRSDSAETIRRTIENAFAAPQLTVNLAVMQAQYRQHLTSQEALRAVEAALTVDRPAT